MNEKKAHNIAASLILPENELAQEIACARGRTYPSTQCRGLARFALSQARKTIEEIILQKTYRVFYIIGDGAKKINSAKEAKYYLYDNFLRCKYGTKAFVTEAERRGFIEGLLEADSDTAYFIKESNIDVLSALIDDITR